MKHYIFRENVYFFFSDMDMEWPDMDEECLKSEIINAERKNDYDQCLLLLNKGIGPDYSKFKEHPYLIVEEIRELDITSKVVIPATYVQPKIDINKVIKYESEYLFNIAVHNKIVKLFLEYGANPNLFMYAPALGEAVASKTCWIIRQI